MPKLLICGDSISAGTGIDTNLVYGKLVATALGYQYVNTSVPGEVAAGVYNNLQTRVFNYSPTHVITMIGTNDIHNAQVAGQGLKPMCDAYWTTMARMIQAYQGKNIKLTLMSSPICLEPSEIMRGQAMANALKDLCAIYSVNFINMFERTASIYNNNTKAIWEAYYQTNDKYHFNRYGQDVLKQIILASQLN